MPAPDVLTRLAEDLTPSREVQMRAFRKIKRRIEGSGVLEEVKGVLTPDEALRQSIWVRILRSISAPEASALLDRVRGALTPPAALLSGLGSHLALRLSPVAVVPVRRRALQWVAAFALFVLLVQLTPQYLLTPRTKAESKVTLIALNGEVAVSLGGLWQPVTQEIALEPGMVLRTRSGQASIVLRDDGVIRLDRATTVEMTDTSDRADLSSSAPETLRLITGRVWVQGLIPSHLRSIDIHTDNGSVSINEGSASISEGEEGTDVELWDHRARILASGEEKLLVAGERVRLPENSPSVVKRISEESYEDPWITQNLERDAVHRRTIAQMQQERRAARAGILPTSTLYPVKRIAEKVDVLLTFDSGARTQKLLDQANGRLDEAAALLQEGEVDAVSVTLADYQDSLVALATGSGDDLVRALVEQSIAEASGDSAALLPGDSGYLIKEAVLAAGASVPDGAVTTGDVQGVLLLDAISSLIRSIDEGAIADVSRIWGQLSGSGSLTLLNDADSPLKPEVRKEATMLLSELAFAVSELSSRGNDAIDPAFEKDVAAYMPPPLDSVVPALSEEEIMGIVKAIRERIFIYNMPNSRINQLIAEFRALEGHPDQGSILRRLYFNLPDGQEHFPERVRKEIIRLQWQKAAQL
ncbi:MAG: DUF5667 domain-containing protein [Candidatus Peregrinibacteria bacterium]